MMTTRRALLGSAAALTLVLPASHVLAQTDPLFQLQWNVVFATPDRGRVALDEIAARGDADLAAGLILAMRVSALDREEISQTLAAITGEGRADTWFDWMLWQEAHPEVVPHPTYARLMREVHLRIDRGFDVFLNDANLQPDVMKIRIEEIVWGGVRVDGIPSLDNPDLIPVAEADYLRPDDLVFGVSINGDTRAYPLRIMGWHEMFNEVIGGVPVALAYCTLCGSGILFETQVPGRAAPLVFGSSGFLYRSNKLMFDRATNSLWNQFTGEPVVGPLVGSGITLSQRPVAIDTWANWSSAHPDSRVLSLETGHRRDYGSGVVYNDYFASPDLMFPALVDETDARQKDYVFGVRQFGGSKAWPLQAFTDRRIINDGMLDTPLVLIGDPDTRSVRAYERGALQFQQSDGGLAANDGTTWQVTEAALIGPDGTQLARVAGHIAYWFAWDSYVGAASERFDG
ncbi:DUF3179 domain-containing protein [Yoonia sp. 208BN28-4]|uniref:DUF3179 domain-containing protein n=1 Tax=Yoonia sp. 208BN28-4 TaxID=3126505 RepID=UPI0030B1ED2F